MRMTQKQLFEQERKKIAEANSHVMEMIRDEHNPLTAEDLHALADRFPQRWEKYRTLLDPKIEIEWLVEKSIIISYLEKGEVIEEEYQDVKHCDRTIVGIVNKPHDVCDLTLSETAIIYNVPRTWFRRAK